MTDIFVSDEIVSAAKLNANLSPVVHARAQELAPGGASISTTESVEMTANLAIPATWLGYDVEASLTADVLETGTLTGERNIEFRIRLTNAAGAQLGLSVLTIPLAILNNTIRLHLPVNGYITGQTATGTVPVVFTAALSNDSGQMSWDNGTLIAHAWRTS